MSPKPNVTLYTASYCGYCVRAERLLERPCLVIAAVEDRVVGVSPAMLEAVCHHDRD
jgi:glutaredoxin